MQAPDHPACFSSKDQGRIKPILINVVETVCKDELRFQFSKRTRGDREKAKKVARRTARVPFRDIRRNGHGCTTKLGDHSEALAIRKGATQGIDAESEIQAGNFAAALESVARISERDPESTRAIELKAEIERASAVADTQRQRQEDLLEAAEARQLSAEKQALHARARSDYEDLESQLIGERGGVFDRFAPSEARGAFAARERELTLLGYEVERLVTEARAALAAL